MKSKKANSYHHLIKAAQQAKQHSYSPYSHFRVGAALLTQSGKIIHGCNVENSSFGLTICAERNALFKAISEGLKKFKAIAISTDAEEFTSPCGACRQVLMELAGDIDVILTNKSGRSKVVTTGDLLPYPFDQANLEQGQRKK